MTNPADQPSTADASADSRQGSGSGGCTLHFLDVKNKLVAGSFSLGGGGVAQVVVLGGEVGVVMRTGRVMQFREVELSTQVRFVGAAFLGCLVWSGACF